MLSVCVRLSSPANFHKYLSLGEGGEGEGEEREVRGGRGGGGGGGGKGEEEWMLVLCPDFLVVAPSHSCKKECLVF